MSEQQTEKVFLSGMYLDHVHEKAPAFVITNQTIHVENFIKWLQENRNLADQKGYIRIVGKESEKIDPTTNKAKRYFEVSTWKPPVKEDTATPEDEKSIPF